MNEQGECVKGKINKLKTKQYGKKKNIWNLHEGIREFKNNYQPLNNTLTSLKEYSISAQTCWG
jgi:uncharacterized coiled-coil DUF342 family protein